MNFAKKFCKEYFYTTVYRFLVNKLSIFNKFIYDYIARSLQYNLVLDYDSYSYFITICN